MNERYLAAISEHDVEFVVKSDGEHLTKVFEVAKNRPFEILAAKVHTPIPIKGRATPEQLIDSWNKNLPSDGILEPAISEFVELKLPPGTRYPRLARPLIHELDKLPHPGMSSPKEEDLLAFKRLYK